MFIKTKMSLAMDYGSGYIHTTATTALLFDTGHAVRRVNKIDEPASRVIVRPTMAIAGVFDSQVLLIVTDARAF